MDTDTAPEKRKNVLNLRQVLVLFIQTCRGVLENSGDHILFLVRIEF